MVTTQLFGVLTSVHKITPETVNVKGVYIFLRNEIFRLFTGVQKTISSNLIVFFRIISYNNGTIYIGGNQKEYYQVAYYLYDQKVIDREFGAFSNIPDNFPKYVLSFDKMDFSRDGIIHKNVLDFLLETI